MGQNLSPAVMAQRREPHTSLDDFPTPPWMTRALCKYLGDRGLLTGGEVWEPACNRGHMARPLAEYFRTVRTSDIHDYGWAGQQEICDFLFPGSPIFTAPEWIITNSPFRLGMEFALKALDTATVGVALLCRSVFTEGSERYNALFRQRRPHLILQFTGRGTLVKGRIVQRLESRDPKHKGGGSGATAYAWFVWLLDRGGVAPATTFDWLPYAKTELERDGDYADIGI